MTRFICSTCGTRYPASARPPAACPICDDARQYRPAGGQRWTTMDEIARGHHNRIDPLEPGLFGIGTEPALAIAQRALLVQTPEGNVLWDCITLLDDDTKRRVEALGGIDAIAISHPHYYSSMAAWAEAFDAPVHLHAADERWVMEPHPRVRFWEGERAELLGGLSLHRVGGHFGGSQVLLWPAGAGGRGALLSGDTAFVTADTAWVSFMYSFPNYVPLPAAEVRRIGAGLNALVFDRIYGAWWEKVVPTDAHGAVQRSVTRYLDALAGRFHAPDGGSPIVEAASFSH